MNDKRYVPDEEDIDHQYTDEIVCPYCGFEYCDSWEMSEDGYDDCLECGKSFYFYKDVRVTYCTNKRTYPVCNCYQKDGCGIYRRKTKYATEVWSNTYKCPHCGVPAVEEK